MQSIECHQDGKQVRLFRNGLVVASGGATERQEVVIDVDLHDQLIDTMRHLAAIPNGKTRKIRFIDLRTGTTREFEDPNNFTAVNWFWENATSDHHIHCKSRFGAIRVFKGKNQVNFLDRDLREILPRDFAAARVADAGHFIVAEGPGRFAVADRTGRVRTPFCYSMMEPGGREGVFIVNGTRFTNRIKKNNVGLIDADGRLILDTIFTSISAIKGTRGLLLVEKNGLKGLTDCTGREVLPIEAMHIAGLAGGAILVKWAEDRFNLFDPRGKRVFEKDVNYVEAHVFEKEPYYLIKEGPKTSVLDTTFRVRFADSPGNLRVFAQSPPCFSVMKLVNDTFKQRVLDANGRILFETDLFDAVSRPVPNLFWVKKDSLHGLFDSKGREIFPMKQPEIAVQLSSKDTVIWVRQTGKKLFSAYGTNGEKRAIPDYFLPTSNQERLIADDYKNGKKWLALLDGSRIQPPDSLDGLDFHGQFPQPESGGFVLFKNLRDDYRSSPKYVFNDRLKNLVPPGFTLADEHGSTERAELDLQITGLLKVWKIARKGEKSAIIESKSRNEQPEIAVEEIRELPEKQVETVEDIVVVEEERPATGTGRGQSPGAKSGTPPAGGSTTGILDHRGNWLLKPVEGVNYAPLSHWLVVEMPFERSAFTQQILKTPVRIHRVGEFGGGPAVIEGIVWIEFRVFQKESPTIRLGRIRDEARQLVEYAWFDKKGQQVTPWGFERGPGYLLSRNLVQVWQPDLTVKQAIIDEKGRILHDLGDLWTWPENLGNAPKPHWLDVPNTGFPWKVEWLEGMVVQRKGDTRQGLMDSTGQLLLPVEFENVQVVERGRLVSAQISATSIRLMDWHGQPVFDFSHESQVKSIPLKNGHLLVSNERETLLISPKNEVVRRFEGAQARLANEDALRENFAILNIKTEHGNRNVFVQIWTGQLFAE